MADIRDRADVRELAEFALAFKDHPDVDELHRRGQAVLESHGISFDLGELAAHYVASPANDEELRRSAREVLRYPVNGMSMKRRRLIGAYIGVLTAALLCITPWAWSVAWEVSESQLSTERTFLSFGFTATPALTLVAIVIMMGMLGSLLVLALTFSSRAGKETLERGYIWWYLLRPFTGAGLAVLFYMTALTGFFNLSDFQKGSKLVLAAALAALAGLFTDQVLKILRGILGQSPFGATTTGREDQTKTNIS